MKALVNKKSGNVIVEFEEGKYNTVAEATMALYEGTVPHTHMVIFGGQNYNYFDVAYEAEMHWGEYKSKYYGVLDTKKGSYNADTKTVTVYMQDDDQMQAIKGMRGLK